MSGTMISIENPQKYTEEGKLELFYGCSTCGTEG